MDRIIRIFFQYSCILYSLYCNVACASLPTRGTVLSSHTSRTFCVPSLVWVESRCPAFVLYAGLLGDFDLPVVLGCFFICMNTCHVHSQCPLGLHLTYWVHISSYVYVDVVAVVLADR